MDSDGVTDWRSSTSGVNIRKVNLFLALTFGLSWSTAVVLYLSDIEYGGLTSLVLVVMFFMWAPAIAAFGVQIWYGDPIRTGTGLVRGRLRWIVLAWVAPVALLAVVVGLGVAIPGVSLTTDYGTYLADLGLPAEQIEESLAVLDAPPVPPIVFFVVQGLVAGLTINALAALGEELGWRGLLLAELAPLGFWRLSVVTGVVWGVWHAPIIPLTHRGSGSGGSSRSSRRLLQARHRA